MAKKHDLPLILHTRKAEARTFEILQEMGVTKADFHCFCGKAKLGKKVQGGGARGGGCMCVMLFVCVWGVVGEGCVYTRPPGRGVVFLREGGGKECVYVWVQDGKEGGSL